MSRATGLGSEHVLIQLRSLGIYSLGSLFEAQVSADVHYVFIFTYMNIYVHMCTYMYIMDLKEDNTLQSMPAHCSTCSVTLPTDTASHWISAVLWSTSRLGANCSLSCAPW